MVAAALSAGGPQAGEALLTLALPKGRLAEEAAGALRAGGLAVPEGTGEQELVRLLPGSAFGRDLRLLWVRPSDVPSYVREGAADAGITGKDALVEEPQGVLERLDLGFGRCRMVVAVRRAEAGRWPELLEEAAAGLTVATKYPRLARRHFLERHGLRPRVLELRGSVEVAATVGMAAAVVDLVQTGATLRASGLVAVEEVLPVSARWIVNPVSLRWKRPLLAELERRLGARAAGEVAAR
ncbi:MAG: ATP phosphoribosyltransferase [Firmicutes bacterium]|nr:ATP phosphoribosyltransferase [Bacillota bacterium]